MTTPSLAQGSPGALDRAPDPAWVVSRPAPTPDGTGGEPRLQVRDAPTDRVILAHEPGCQVIFDGVLYNRTELNDTLASGATPPLNDVELILRAYLRWGDDVLHRVKGIFALIVWDAKTQTLLCARDPLGVYPLFCADAGTDLLFSTSIDALVQQPGVSGAVNRLALADHLAHRWPKPEETYVASVSRVPPGHALRIDRTGRQAYRYWDPVPPGTEIQWVSRDELERFDELLDQAVTRCLGQGRVGIYLSGGLDSVSVAAVAADNSRRQGLPPPLALSLIYPSAATNEEPIQRGVAADLGLPHVTLPFFDAVGGSELLPKTLAVASQRPVPLLNPWNPAYHRLGREAKNRGCSVILTGGGGDEWLSVSPFLAADLIRKMDIQGLYRLWGTMWRSYQASPWRTARTVLWTFGARPVAGTAARWALSNTVPGVLRARQRRRIRQAMPVWLAPDPTLRRELARRADLKRSEGGLGGYYLHEGRVAYDHPLTSIEMEEFFENGRRLGLRFLQPYWDADLVDFLYRMPPELLNQGGRSKGLVRGMLARRFPDRGFEKQKKVQATGFFRSMMLQEGAHAWEIMGGTPALAELGIVDPHLLDATVRAILADPQSSQSFVIWDLLSLEAWARPRL